MILYILQSIVLFAVIFVYCIWLEVQISHDSQCEEIADINGLYIRSFDREVKYYHYSGGLGNKMYGLVSSYIIAAVLNARLTFEKKYLFEDLMDVYDWNGRLVVKDQQDEDLSNYELHTHSGSCYSENGPLSRLLVNSSLSDVFRARRTVVRTNCPLFQWIMCNNDSRQILRDRGLITFYNDSAPPEINGFWILSSIVRRFKIKPNILADAKKRISWRPNYMVNAYHIRLGQHRAFNDTSFFMFEDDIPQYIYCAKKQSLQGEKTFVATDSLIAKEYYSQVPNHIISPINVIHTEKTKNRTIYYETFTDIATISICSSLVGTIRSSFTTVSGAFQGNIPYYILRRWIGACRHNITVRFG